MRPDPEIAIEGIGAVHRVDSADREMVRVWRNAPDVRGSMYTTHEISPAEHAAWWAAMMADPARRYCIAHGPDGPLGVVGFTRLDMAERHAEWALYAAPGAPRGAGARMGALSMELAFGRWALTGLTCEVREENARARALYDRLGFEAVSALQSGVADAQAPALRLALAAEVWRSRRAAMLVALAAEGATR
jgi:UDP-4-amino-4,6-dideoxy-N-acetyl-beta-L-altrosamine N-acetyltransferase